MRWDTSWETVVVGRFEIKDEVDAIEEAIVVRSAEDTFSCEVKCDGEWGEYFFEDVNWTSHVSEDKIEDWLQEHKDKLESWDIRLFYLGDPNHSWNSHNQEEVE